MQVKFAGVAACAAAAVLASAGIATAASSKPVTPSAVTTFHLVEIDNSFNIVVDTPPKLVNDQSQFSAGDTFVFSSELRTPSGKHAGWLNAQCTAMTGGKNAVTGCNGAFRLAGGELVLAATVAGDHKVTNIAIIGGTGAYAGARGQVKSVSAGPNGNRSNDTVTFWK